MKILYFYIPLCIVFLIACKPKSKSVAELFSEKDGCLLLMNLNTKSYDYVWNERRCRQRFPACSTFKVPLALMAFDAHILKDENQTLQWDGKTRMLAAWNHDHNAMSWLRDSVVWFSQRLTPMLGKKQLEKYLHDFHYGNEDMSGGLTEAWLHAPGDGKPALSISAYEQTMFMADFWQNHLPIEPRATSLIKRLTYLETSPDGFVLSGKTGSNFDISDKRKRFGWFIAHLQKANQEYVLAANFNDLKPSHETAFGGQAVKEIAKTFLKTQGLW